MDILGDIVGDTAPDVLAEGFAAAASGPTRLLDSVAGLAAWSFIRKAQTDYSGAAFRLREDGGDTEVDIGFDGEVVDEAAILAHCGSNSGYVVTAYDQTGNSRDLTEATAANQPRIVNAGTLEVSNGKAMARFITDTWLMRTDASGMAGNPGWTWGMLVSVDAGTRIFNFVGEDAGGTAISVWGDTSHRYLNGNEVFADALPTTGVVGHLLSTQPAGGQYDSGQLFIDGVESATSSTGSPTNTVNITNDFTVMGAAIGGTSPAWWVENSYQEWIVFAGALSASNRAALIAEQMSAGGL